MTIEEFLQPDVKLYGEGNITTMFSFDEPYSEAELEEIKKIAEEKEKKRKIKFLKLLTPEVQNMFLEYPTYDYKFSSNDYKTKRKGYFVYESYTTDDETPIYVGVVQDPNYHYTIRKDKRIIMLDEMKGISERIITENLTELQAVVYCHSYKYKCIDNYGYLLNVGASSLIKEFGREQEILSPNPKKGEPSFVYKDAFFSTYFPEIYRQKQAFDNVTLDDLSTVFFDSNEDNQVVEWLTRSNAKINKSCSTGVKSVIIDNWIDYFKYEQYKKDGKKVLAVEDVKDFISKYGSSHDFGLRKPVKVPNYDSKLREEIRCYLTENKNNIEEYYKYVDEAFSPIDRLEYWNNPFATPMLSECRLEPQQEAIIISIIKYKKIAMDHCHRGDGMRYMDDLIEKYMQFGLFDEILEILKDTEHISARLQRVREIAETDKMLGP